MKKLLLGLGSIAAIAAPVAAVVACGSDDKASGTVVKTNASEQLDFIHALVGPSATAKDVTDIKVTVSGDAAKSAEDMIVTFNLKAELKATDEVTAMKAGSNTIEYKMYIIDKDKKPVQHTLVNNKAVAEGKKLDFITDAIKEFNNKAQAALAAAAVKTAAGGDAALTALKDLDSKTINASGLKDSDKTKDLKLVKDAKDMAALTAVMATINTDINAVANAGTATNAGGQANANAGGQANANAGGQANANAGGSQVKTVTVVKKATSTKLNAAALTALKTTVVTAMNTGALIDAGFGITTGLAATDKITSVKYDDGTKTLTFNYGTNQKASIVITAKK